MFNRKVLLLNASNKENFPVYPYAFIQVPAVARRAEIEVICKDLLGIHQEGWKQIIQTLIEQHNPAMILITLRNTDALVAREYKPDESKAGEQSAYFPIERTKELIAAIREVSDLKIVVGGFGFSLLPDELMRYLRPDYGVLGGPDDFFAHFEEIRKGDLGRVPSLLFFQDAQLVSNPRILYSPFADAEYTPQIIQEMMEFYTAFPSPGFQGAPVEIMRGCNHACVFCAEPHSVGRKVRYRDLSAVMKDIEILAKHGITRLYTISSELNPEGNEFILQLADRIHSFNTSQSDDRKITWFGANYLLNFNSDEYERLSKSGFTGGWFDITGLDDENARVMRTPYRNTVLIKHLATYAEHQKKQISRLQNQKAWEAEARGRAGDGREDELVRWSMFLGNPAATIETIRNTIRTANRAGLSNRFDVCGIIDSTRVFNYEEPTESVLVTTLSVTPKLEPTSYQQLLPSFVYPPTLLQTFSEKEIPEMFSHIAETYLSIQYQKTRDWYNFVRQKTTAESIANWMAELSGDEGGHNDDHTKPATEGGLNTLVKELFSEHSPEARTSYQNMAIKTVNILLATCLETFPIVFRSLGLPETLAQLERTTSYEVAVSVFNQWCTEGELTNELYQQTQSHLSELMIKFIQFCVQAILYRFNVQLNSKYRAFFV